MFNAIVIERKGTSSAASLQQLEDERLPESEVTVEVEFSTLNYKDALAISGRGTVVRSFPMVPGIDLAGTVTVSPLTDNFSPGSKVLLNGWGVGEQHWGGLAQQARVEADWLIPVPAPLSTRDAMAIGTAGYTAMLCVLALERHQVTPQSGEIVVTGAAGGVGSIAIAILAKLGYRVVGVTGRASETSYLQALGASEVLPRDLFNQPGKPLNKARWAGAVDVVGSHTLANICASMQRDGVVTACGLAGGIDFPATVAPFILRGVTLIGIDSVFCTKAVRLEAWRRLAADLDLNKLQEMTSEIDLNAVLQHAALLMEGKVRGRLVVNLHPER